MALSSSRLSSLLHAYVVLVLTASSLVLVVNASGGSSLISMARAVANPATFAGGCNYAGRKLTLGMPTTLDQNGTFFQFGQIQIAAQNLVVDFINEVRCGVHLKSGEETKNYALELRYFDDESSVFRVQEIANYLADNVADNDVDLLLCGYSSLLTLPYAEITHQHNRLVISATASDREIYAERNTTFGIPPPAGSFFQSALEAVAKAGAKTVATVSENYSSGLASCSGVPAMAKALGMRLTSAHVVPQPPNVSQFERVLQDHLVGEDPDVVITCTLNCTAWVTAMRNSGWSPKAQAFKACVGTPDFEETSGSDAQYMMSASLWHPSVKESDPVTGWPSSVFAELFLKESSHEAITYHAAAFATAISILVQAIEATQTYTDETTLAKYMAQNTFKTTMGNIAFDANGQNKVPMLLIQNDATGNVQTVYPEAIRSATLLYPMPSWDQRDCRQLSVCGSEESPGTCDADGLCVCSNPDQVSVGWGSTAACNPAENMNYIPDSLHVFGHVMFGITALMAVMAAVWIYWNRFTMIVKASQPVMLGFIVVGCFISNLAILFLGVETGYRVEITNKDGIEENPDISRVDASCMAAPWLYGTGFAVTFAALFVKIERVRLISAAKKQHAGDLNAMLAFRQSLPSLVVVLAVELGVLLSWQLVSPFRWEREVLMEENGLSVESVGRCKSENGFYFYYGMIGWHVILLLFALVLAFRVRHIDDAFAESNSLAMVVACMFQVLVLAIPISIMVEENNDIFYLVQVGLVALQNFAVLGLMFIPKVMKQAGTKDGELTGTVREQIPIASLTFCQWDEGIDLIHELMNNDALSQEDKLRLVGLKTLVLRRNVRQSKDEQKRSYVPESLLAKTPANNFIMEEFGGVTNMSDCSSSTFSGDVTHVSITKSSREASSTEFLTEDDAPPEFRDLEPEKQERLRHLLSLPSLEKWGFDVFELVELTGGNPLLFVGWAILGSPRSQMAMAEICGETYDTSSYQLFHGYYFTHKKRGLGIKMSTLCNYLRAIEGDYCSSNPYHNETHAADVLQTLHALLCMMEDSTRLQTNKEQLFSVLLAAVVHDVKHPGRNNAFQVNARTGYAFAHNNESVLENMHVSHAFNLMLGREDQVLNGSKPIDVTKDDNNRNVLSNITRAQFDSIRTKMIDAILHTDMSKHFEFVATMKVLVASNRQGQGEQHWDDDDGSFATGAVTTDNTAEHTNHSAVNTHRSSALGEKNVWQVLLFLLHLADISGQTKPNKLRDEWSNRVHAEFFEQGDQERSLGMPISFLCDRNAVKIAESQVGYMKFVIEPAFHICGQLVPAVEKFVVPLIEQNTRHWEKQKAKQD